MLMVSREAFAEMTGKIAAPGKRLKRVAAAEQRE
jgi:hypothetical protein